MAQLCKTRNGGGSTLRAGNWLALVLSAIWPRRWFVPSEKRRQLREPKMVQIGIEYIDIVKA